LAGSEPDYHVKDLFNKIEKGDFPTWILGVQVMKPEEVQQAPIDIFDCTFTWPHDKYPLRTIGRLTLNENVCVNGCSMRRAHADIVVSHTTISKTLNKRPSLHQTWYQGSVLPQTWVCTVTSFLRIS
jgi:hypothetical protein